MNCPVALWVRNGRRRFEAASFNSSFILSSLRSICRRHPLSPSNCCRPVRKLHACLNSYAGSAACYCSFDFWSALPGAATTTSNSNPYNGPLAWNGAWIVGNKMDFSSFWLLKLFAQARRVHKHDFYFLIFHWHIFSTNHFSQFFYNSHKQAQTRLSSFRKPATHTATANGMINNWNEIL